LGSWKCSFLKKPFWYIQANPIFKEMTYSTDFSKLKEWMPLVMEGTRIRIVLQLICLSVPVNFWINA
jgi:L-2-hydroxyglutarate oxidase LhgO